MDGLSYVTISKAKLLVSFKLLDKMVYNSTYDKVKFDKIIKDIRTHLIVVSNNK